MWASGLHGPAHHFIFMSSVMHIHHISFIVTNEIARAAFNNCAETMVIVDPPRQGLEKDLVSILIDKKPKNIIYVSCAPDTLARDLKLLTADLYEVVDCQLIDMFPRTTSGKLMLDLNLAEPKSIEKDTKQKRRQLLMVNS